MRSKSAKRMVGKWINVPKRQDFRFWPDSEMAQRPDGVRFLGYSGLVVLTASLSESDPKRPSRSRHKSRILTCSCGSKACFSATIGHSASVVISNSFVALAG